MGTKKNWLKNVQFDNFDIEASLEYEEVEIWYVWLKCMKWLIKLKWENKFRSRRTLLGLLSKKGEVEKFN